MRTVFVSLSLCFLVSLSYAAATFTIPQGINSFGPVSVNGKTEKYSTFSMDRSLWTNPAITLDGQIDWTSDGSNWIPFCPFSARGNPKGTPPVFVSCPFPPTATQIRGTANVQGGSITVTAIPQLGAK
jgi:hypothetical protein